MTRDQLISETRRLVAEGERLALEPSLGGLRVWLKLSDDLLAAAWGSMDRYHLSWLMVGRPQTAPRGRPMTPQEESDYVREVASQKTAALRMSLDAVERQQMPFVGETGGVASGHGSIPGVPARGYSTQSAPAVGSREAAASTGTAESIVASDSTIRADSTTRVDSTVAAGSTIRADSTAHAVREPMLTRAVGGERDVPAPDPIARDYLLLALRLDQHRSGLVDGYFGPADLKAQVDLEQLRPPDRLIEDAQALAERVAGEVDDAARRRWLTAQLAALSVQAAASAGRSRPYLEEVRVCTGLVPSRTPDAALAATAAALEELVPGKGSLAERFAVWDAGLTVASERLPGIVHWLIDVFRARAAALFSVPEGETLSVNLVRGQPWSAYNWYEGGLRSRVDLNIDLPVRAPDLLRVLPHETYPGHHLEHVRKEIDLVFGRFRLEASILLINTPECVISEGLAEVGSRLLVPVDEQVDLLSEVLVRAGIAEVGSGATARRLAERHVEIELARRGAGGAAGTAALLLHADGWPREEVRAYLERWLFTTTDRADKRLSFIEHPLWRPYVFAYHESEQLLSRWLELVPAADRPARFARLLSEQLTPGVILEELGLAGRS